MFCSELAAVVVSLLCYFLSVITVFTAAAVVVIGLFNVSTSGKVRHYPHPRPEIERTVTATSMEPRLFMVVPETKDGSPAKDVPGTKDESPAKNIPGTKDESPAKDIKDSRAVRQADAENRKDQKLAYLHKLTRQRENYPVAVGYAAQSGYRPGLDSQR
jgi:hypothetical protein